MKYHVTLAPILPYSVRVHPVNAKQPRTVWAKPCIPNGLVVITLTDLCEEGCPRSGRSVNKRVSDKTELRSVGALHTVVNKPLRT